MTVVACAESLYKSYGGVAALSDLSFEVAAGEALALLGPNGSGKTTTLRCLAGLIRPDSGIIRIRDYDLERQPREAKRHFSYLPQKASFPGELTMGEVIRFHARLRGADEQAAIQALRQAGIEGSENKRISQLSGGTIQRLSLAVASVGEAGLMILDEPTASLDPEAALSFHQVAASWRSQGRALVFATHVLADVEKLADRVLILIEGKCAALESVGRLREEVSKTALLRVEVDRPSPEHVRVALERGASDVQLNCSYIVISAPAEHRYRILEGLSALGPVRRFYTEEPSVDTVYLRYVKFREGETDVK